MKNLLLFAVLVTLPLLLGGCGEKEEPVAETKPEEPVAETKPAEEAPVNPIKYKITGDAVTITGCDEDASGKLVIPALIEGKSVTPIGDGAFLPCTSLTSITTPIASPASERLPSTPAPAPERKFLAINNVPSIQSPSPS